MSLYALEVPTLGRTTLDTDALGDALECARRQLAGSVGFPGALAVLFLNGEPLLELEAEQGLGDSLRWTIRLVTDVSAFRCWCGAELDEEALDEMIAELPSTCGGTGTLRCECGGDLCVCHNHGEVDCDGCRDCEPRDPCRYCGEIACSCDDDWRAFEAELERKGELA